uniref:Uncharacterized protein n=1 Tax=Arundo donax TaxID=35708 RepID=A0A0A9H7R9_ARUDO
MIPSTPASLAFAASSGLPIRTGVLNFSCQHHQAALSSVFSNKKAWQRRKTFHIDNQIM